MLGVWEYNSFRTICVFKVKLLDRIESAETNDRVLGGILEQDGLLSDLAFSFLLHATPPEKHCILFSNGHQSLL